MSRIFIFHSNNSETQKQIDFKKVCESGYHTASSPISQSSFFEEVYCLIFASSQRKRRDTSNFLNWL